MRGRLVLAVVAGTVSPIGAVGALRRSRRATGPSAERARGGRRDGAGPGANRGFAGAGLCPTHHLAGDCVAGGPNVAASRRRLVDRIRRLVGR